MRIREREGGGEADRRRGWVERSWVRRVVGRGCSVEM